MHAAERRLEAARILEPTEKTINKEAFLRFLVHGVPYAFAVSEKEVTRGMPTAWAAPVLADHFAATNQLPPVWSDPNGRVQGVAVKPLYASAPKAAKQNVEFYDLLALVDALRIGRVRERKLAEQELEERLNAHAVA